MKAAAWVRASPVIGIAGLVLNMPLMVVLGILAWLRETPRFWTHAGGYPVWLRHWVLVGYPLFVGFELVFLSWMTVALLRVRRGGGEVGALVGMALVIFQWLWVSLVLVFLVWDNVANLIEGRPWHWTAP